METEMKNKNNNKVRTSHTHKMTNYIKRRQERRIEEKKMDSRGRRIAIGIYDNLQFDDMLIR